MTEKTTAPEKTACPSGHPYAEFRVTTASGSRCRACANEASKRSRAKNPRSRSPRTLTPEVRDYLESLFKASKKGSAELRELVEAFFEAHR